jgi:hypothetical protein
VPLSVEELAIADPAEAWAGAGFGVDSDATCQVGGVRIRLVGPECGTGIIGWSLTGLPADGPVPDLDGIPTRTSAAAATTGTTHPNGVTAIDHVVVFSPDLRRTVDALAAVGATPRRERDPALGGLSIRQIFFRFGEVIIEVIGSPELTSAEPSTLWGITYNVADIDDTAAFFGANTAPVKDAVQPGRRITTLRHRDLGMSVRTAFISAPILGA